MKKLLLLAMFVVAGCRDTTSPAAMLDVSATLSSATKPYQGSISVNLAIHNRGRETVLLALSECVPPYEVLDANGVVIGPPMSDACTLSLVAPVVIEPGETGTYTSTWTGAVTSTDPTVAPVYAGPGTYLIRPKVQVGEGSYAYGPAVAVTVVQ